MVYLLLTDARLALHALGLGDEGVDGLLEGLVLHPREVELLARLGGQAKYVLEFSGYI